MSQRKLNRIKAILVEKGVSNKALAEKMNVTQGTVSTWCRNFKQPGMDTLFDIADYLQVEARDLLCSMKTAGY